MNLLEINTLSVAYGGIRAVQSVDLQVAEGELVCLIGANGAGKTSILKGLMGLVPYDGEARFAGKHLMGRPTHAIVADGMVLVPEGRGIFARLSVQENLDMGAYIRRDRSQIARDLEHVHVLFPRLAERGRQLAGTLSGGEQQMLALGRALMARPRLLLLDEPSMGLAPLMVQKIYRTITEIARQGVTILLVEQNANLALKVSQRGYVMEHGTIVLAGSSRELLDDPQVQDAYLGQ